MDRPTVRPGACRGDLVRNLATNEVGRVTGSTQFGRIIVEVPYNCEGCDTKMLTKVWERFAIDVVKEPSYDP